MSQVEMFAPPVLAVEDVPDLLSTMGEVPHAFEWAFEAMGVAEEAIAEAVRSNPTAAPALDRAFLVLRARYEVFAGIARQTVRAHMDELLRRIASKGPDADVVSGTAAEVCCALANISLAAPLKHEYAVVYHVAFIDAFGEEQATSTIGEEAIRRAQMDRDDHLKFDIYRQLRHHMRDEERGRAWKDAATPSSLIPEHA